MKKQKLIALGVAIVLFASVLFLFRKDLAPPEEKKVVDNKALLEAYLEPVQPVHKTTIPTIQGAATYKKDMRDGKLVVKFPINIWGGWTPLLVANGGLKTTPDSIFGKKGLAIDFIVNENSIDVMKGFANGDYHILWGTLDMVALYAPVLSVDSRTSPIVCQQIDFSSGGDGIVARNGIQKVNDLGTPSSTGGKRKVVLAENSPSQFFLVSLLLTAGIDINNIEFIYGADPIAASKLYVQNKDIDAFVGWAPQIYELPDLLPDSKTIITTSTANQWIADVYAWRNDFFQEQKQIVTSVTDGIFEAMQVVRNPEKYGTTKENIWKLFADSYGLDIKDAEEMIGDDGMVFATDAHLTNYRENINFFKGTGNSNFETIWNRATNVYIQLGVIKEGVSAARVKSTEILDSLEDKWRDSVDMSQREFNPSSVRLLPESEAISKRIVINFKPNSIEVDPVFDPTIPETVKELQEMVSGFGYAMIVVEGHVDGSRKGVISADDAKDVSLQRAEAVKDYLVKNYEFKSNQMRAVGKGWTSLLPNYPNMDDPEHRKMNRRVEVKIYTVETE